MVCFVSFCPQRVWLVCLVCYFHSSASAVVFPASWASRCRLQDGLLVRILRRCLGPQLEVRTSESRPSCCKRFLFAFWPAVALALLETCTVHLEDTTPSAGKPVFCRKRRAGMLAIMLAELLTRLYLLQLLKHTAGNRAWLWKEQQSYCSSQAATSPASETLPFKARRLSISPCT